MAKINPNYPDTSTRGPEMPIGVLVRKVDKNYDRDRARDLAYKFSQRKFFEDPLAHGAYLLRGSLDPLDVVNAFVGIRNEFAPSPGEFVIISTGDELRMQNGFDVPPGPDPMEGAVYKGS